MFNIIAIVRGCAEFLLPQGDREAGDVPGWVLITLMTAALVAAIWAVADEALLSLFDQAMARFSGR